MSEVDNFRGENGNVFVYKWRNKVLRYMFWGHKKVLNDMYDRSECFDMHDNPMVCHIYIYSKRVIEFNMFCLCISNNRSICIILER